MSRWASSTNETEAARPSVVFAVLVELDFVGGFVRAHDGIGNLTHDGNTYYGVGQFGGIDGVSEDTETSGKGLELTLTGIPADLSPDIIAETGYQNRTATLYIGILDPQTNAWVATPEVLWDGYMDFLEIRGEEGSLEIRLRVEDELRREPPLAYNTDEDQQSRYAGDRFFSDVANVQIFRATWGQSPVGVGQTRMPVKGLGRETL